MVDQVANNDLYTVNENQPALTSTTCLGKSPLANDIDPDGPNDELRVIQSSRQVALSLTL